MLVRLALINPDGSEQITEFRRERITLGRSRNNDVVLNAENVSREHAVIFFRNGAAYLTNQGKYGTLLNGKELGLEQEHALALGDRIVICDHTVVFQRFEDEGAENLSPATESAPPLQRNAPAQSRAARDRTPAAQTGYRAFAEGAALSYHEENRTPLLAHEAKVIAKELDGIYRKHVASEAAVRKQHLQEALEKRLRRFSRHDREEIVRLLKERFFNKDEVWERLIAENNEMKLKLEAIHGKENLASEAYETMANTAKRLLDGAPPFRAEPELARFGENMRQALESFLAFFIDLNRSRFRSMETDLTQIDSKFLALGPLQRARSVKELGRQLLDWNGKDDNRKTHELLENALNDFLFHELALQSGFQEGLWNGAQQLFHRFNPSVIEEQVGRTNGGAKFFMLPQKILVLLYEWRCWRLYKKEFKELKEEFRTMFKGWFRAAFQQAYEAEFQNLQSADTDPLEKRMRYRAHIETGLPQAEIAPRGI